MLLVAFDIKCFVALGWAWVGLGFVVGWSFGFGVVGLGWGEALGKQGYAIHAQQQHVL